MMKYATVLFHELMEEQGYYEGKHYRQVLHVHDEAECECSPDLAETLGQTFVRAIELAGQHFGFPCPTTGEYKVGSTWAATH
jgi:DNA polymerase I-like protein with 3'-5' exonuclease and polymerase domains